MEATRTTRPNLTVRRETVIEIVGYVGAAGALTAAGIALGESSGTGVQIGFDLITAAVLLAAGWVLDDRLDIFARMRSIFWFLSVFAVVDLASTLLREVFDLSTPRALVIVTALIAAAYALVLWWLCRRSLQAIALIVLTYVIVLAAVFPTPNLALGAVPNVTPLALVTLALGVATVFAGLFGILSPPKTTVALGSIAAIVGPLLFLVNGHDVLAEVLSLVVAVLLIGAGDVWSERVAAGLGIAGLLIVSAALVGTNVTEQGAAIAVLLVALVLLGGALFAAQQDTAPAAAAAGPDGETGSPVYPGPSEAGPDETPPAPPPPPPPGSPTEG